MYLLCIQCQKTWEHSEFLSIRNDCEGNSFLICCDTPARIWVEGEEE